MQAPDPGGIIKIMYALTRKYRNGLIYWALPRLFFFSVLLMMPRVTISTHPLERLQWRSPHPRSRMSNESCGGEHCHWHRPSTTWAQACVATAGGSGRCRAAANGSGADYERKPPSVEAEQMGLRLTDSAWERVWTAPSSSLQRVRVCYYCDLARTHSID